MLDDFRNGIHPAADDSALARKAQNPVSDPICRPFQNNTDGGIGPNDAVQNTTNAQPVWPINANGDWNVITRTILPVVYQHWTAWPGEPSSSETTNTRNATAQDPVS